MNNSGKLTIHSEAFRETLSTLSLLGGFGFVTGNLGHLSPQLSTMLALLLLALFTSLHFRPSDIRLGNASRKAIIKAIAMFVLSAVVWTVGGTVGQCLAIVLFILSLNWILDGLNHSQGKLVLYLMTASIITLFVLLYEYVPQIYFVAQEVSHLLSYRVTNLINRPLRLGATASGFHILIFFWLYAFSLFWLAENRSWKHFTKIALGGLLLNILYLLIHPFVFIPILKLFQNTYHLGHNHSRGYTITSLNTQIFLLGMLAVPIFLAERAWRTRKLIQKEFRLSTALAGGALVFVGILAMSYLPLRGLARNKVLLYDKGFLNWDRPVFDKYGERAGGMFGMLPDYLRAAGFEADKGAVIDDSTLKNYSTVIVINLQNSFTTEEHAAIWRFIRNGGSLLALGDHTGLAGIREPFNYLLAPVGVEFNFDSAHYISDWSHAFKVFPHAATYQIEPDRKLGISVGASLNVPPSVAPVVIGKYGL